MNAYRFAINNLLSQSAILVIRLMFDGKFSAESALDAEEVLFTLPVSFQVKVAGGLQYAGIVWPKMRFGEDGTPIIWLKLLA